MLKVDCHTHWGRCWQTESGDDPSAWIQHARSYGVSHAIVLPHVGLEHAGRIASEHDHMAVICARSEGMMQPFCTACVREPDEALSEVRRCLEQLKFRGVKFHPWLQGCSVSSPTMDAIAELAAAFDVPMLFHDGTPPFSLPSQIALLAQRHPRTKIILGHSGLYEHFREAAAAVRSTENLWACLCGPHLAGMRHVIDRCPLERLLWGTDVGYSMADVHRYRVPLMADLKLTDAQQIAIYSENPRQLLKLETTPPPHNETRHEPIADQ